MPRSPRKLKSIPRANTIAEIIAKKELRRDHNDRGGDCGVSRGVSKTRAMSQVVSPVDVRTYCVSRDVSVGVSSGVSSCAALTI